MAEEKSIEQRIADLEEKVGLLDQALGGVVAFVREHNHDHLGGAYVPSKL